MRNSGIGFLLRLLLVVGLAILVWALVQSAWMGMITNLLAANQGAALPISGTPISGFPTQAPSVPIGTERTMGDLAISVTRVLRPADAAIYAGYYKQLDQADEFIAVGIQARCIASDQSCRLAETDFGVNAESGQDYMAEFSNNFEGVRGLFDGGEMAAGQSLSGDVVFIVPREASGLLLIYPGMYSFGNEARFRLRP